MNFAVYCDESGPELLHSAKPKARFMVIGSLWLPEAARIQAIYCAGAVTTFDRIRVRFQKRDFDHCFFESSQRNRIKDTFSQPRAERLEWIAAALQDAAADRFQGWDRDTKSYDKTRRVTLVCGNYVVVIAVTGATSARFLTAYVADTPNTLAKLKTSPKWTP